MVEATIALHYVFNSPKDKIVFDVSHQSYVHKMLTGRKDAFLHPENTITYQVIPNRKKVNMISSSSDILLLLSAWPADWQRDATLQAAMKIS